MGRRIAVFSDGTGNSAGSPEKTNVWRAYDALDLTRSDQIAMFDDGVGTSWFTPQRYLGLAFGFGLKRNVLDLYKFICRNYVPGDDIHAFGFSRGGFTVRVLVGMINRVGLVRFTSEAELDRQALAAYRLYRRLAFPSRLPWVAGLRRLRDTALRLADRLRGWDSFETIRADPRRHHPAGSVKVRFVGVWDTVAAYGLPIDELTRAVDRWIWPLDFRSRTLPGNVVTARQALCLDDERRTFWPIPWEEPREGRVYGQSLDDARLLQAWFAGVHADVGGGYPDARLSHVSLDWMLGEAARCGLRFDADKCAEYAAAAASTGRIHDSRAGFGMFYRYHPRSLRRLMPGAVPLLHESVVLRMAEGSDHYAPIAIDADIDILAAGNVPLPFGNAGRIAAGTGRAAAAFPPEWAGAVSAVAALVGSGTHAERQACTDLALDLVWWRRLIYMATMALGALFACCRGSRGTPDRRPSTGSRRARAICSARCSRWCRSSRRHWPRPGSACCGTIPASRCWCSGHSPIRSG
jgi:uncharacterized protein (DUF2235 family)